MHVSSSDGRQNVPTALRVRKMPSAEIATRAEQALAKVKMSAYARSNHPKSQAPTAAGGVTRALVNRPRLLLLDEPLSALDANLPRQMQVELKLYSAGGISFVLLLMTRKKPWSCLIAFALAFGRTGGKFGST